MSMGNKLPIDLDNLQTYQKYDHSDMLRHIHNFPRLCELGWQLTKNIDLPDDYRKINKIVILGMGGSAIGGDLIAGLAVNEAAVPIIMCRDYQLPRHVDKDTLVIASSYSGMTEETLSAFKEACQTPAKKLAITTGGRLKEICESQGIPVLTFDYECMPRAALPYSFFMLLGLLQNLKVFKDKTDEVAIAFKDIYTIASKLIESVPLSANAAKGLADKLNHRLPVVYGGGITGPVAQCWKIHLNENGKTMAFYEVFSELTHNAIVGYQLPEEIISRCHVVMLDSELLHKRIRLRYEITQKLLERASIPYQVIKAEGSTAISHVMGLVLFGDYVSYYLGILNGVDPTPIKSVDFLKNSLAKK
jgi:glucose/mannose-6-phosphate isomerase